MLFKSTLVAAAALALSACMPNAAAGPDTGPAEPTAVPSGDPAADDSVAPPAQVRLRILAASPDGEPLRVLVVRGLDVFKQSAGFNIDISEWKSSSAASLFMSDLSSLTLHESTGHLLLLSDESALVVEYAPDGQPISVLPLWRGFNGLQRKVPQPEGLAVSAVSNVQTESWLSCKRSIEDATCPPTVPPGAAPAAVPERGR